MHVCQPSLLTGLFVRQIFTIAISGNMASYLQNTGNHQWRYNFHLVSYSATAIITYALLVPAALWAFLQWSVRGTELNMEEDEEEQVEIEPTTPSLLSLVCVYGYSLAIYIPVSVLWTIQVGREGNVAKVNRLR